MLTDQFRVRGSSCSDNSSSQNVSVIQVKQSHSKVLYLLFQNVCNFMLVGPYSRAIKNRPALPPGGDENHMLALPRLASKNADKIFFFICSDANEFK